jgi:hypothetical protein
MKDTNKIKKWNSYQNGVQKIIKKQIDVYYYFLVDGVKKEGDYVISKHQIDEQIGNSKYFMNSVFAKPFEIGIGQCELDYRFNPPMLHADNIALSGNALQERCYKIVETDNPNIILINNK